MLGEKIGEISGKVTMQRVVPNLGGDPKMETSFQANGSVLGTNIKDTGTYWTVFRPDGKQYSEGQGVMITKDGKTATWTGHGVGVRNKDGQDYGPTLCVLGLIDAALGRKDLALEEGRRAIALMPVEKDVLNGSLVLQSFAITAAWAGEKELALQQLETGLRAPTASQTLSYGALKLQPLWDPLRGDPRFEKIVASLAPKRQTNKATENPAPTLYPVVLRGCHRCATAPINRSHSSKLPQNPNSQAVLRLSRALISRRLLSRPSRHQ